MLLVRGPAADRIDEIRRRWDPVMAGRIGPHVTLLHDVTDHAAAAQRLTELAAETPPVKVRLTVPACWAGTATYGVYLGVDDPTGGVAAVHGALADLEAPAWARVPYRPHVTLVHGRTVGPELADQAWRALREERFDVTVELDAIDVLELIEPAGWSTVQTAPLTAGV